MICFISPLSNKLLLQCPSVRPLMACCDHKCLLIAVFRMKTVSILLKAEGMNDIVLPRRGEKLQFSSYLPFTAGLAIAASSQNNNHSLYFLIPGQQTHLHSLGKKLAIETNSSKCHLLHWYIYYIKVTCLAGSCKMVYFNC